MGRILHLTLMLLAIAVSPVARAGFGGTGGGGGGPVIMGNGPPPKPLPPPNVCDQELEQELEVDLVPNPTPRLVALGQQYPELRDVLMRNNFCLSDGGECEGRSPAEIDLEEADALQRQKLNAEAAQRGFHGGVTEADFDEARDSLATVSRQGFFRHVRNYKLLFRLYPDRKFHESAEGVDLITQRAVDAEAAANKRLLEIFDEMEPTLKKEKDQASLDALAIFRERAARNANNLGLIACEYGRLAAKNREIEERMGALTASAIPMSAVSGEVPIATLDATPGNVTVEQTASRAPAFTRAEAEILAPFGVDLPTSGASRSPALAPANGEESLFIRVHRKHQEKEALGIFRRSILD